MDVPLQYINYYSSPLGNILLSADDGGLTGLWFEQQRHFATFLTGCEQTANLHVFNEVRCWLDAYFSGRNPDFTPQLHMIGTGFQQSVWRILLTIPYGQIVTYGQIAEKLEAERGVLKMSARAVGSAVGHNHISLIIPCHRVVGSNGNLTGYAGGIERKVALLKIEADGRRRGDIKK